MDASTLARADHAVPHVQIKQRKIDTSHESKGFLANLTGSISGPKFVEFDEVSSLRPQIGFLNSSDQLSLNSTLRIVDISLKLSKPNSDPSSLPSRQLQRPDQSSRPPSQSCRPPFSLSPNPTSRRSFESYLPRPLPYKRNFTTSAKRRRSVMNRLEDWSASRNRTPACAQVPG